MAMPNWPATPGLPALVARISAALKAIQLPFASSQGETAAPRIFWGQGGPNGVIVGTLGDVYLNQNGGASTTLWVKESGVSTSTGWVGK